MIFKNLLELGSICQGDCIRAGDYQGVFIAKISERESVIATYNNTNPKYINVPTKEISPSDKKDGRLIEFAQRHVLWHHKQKIEGRKDEAKRNPDRKKNRKPEQARRNNQT
jgi:hypothetical protein